MTVQTVKLAGKRFVILPEKAYKDLERRAKGSSASVQGTRRVRPSRPLNGALRERLEDEADARAARRALAEMRRKKQKPIPWEQVKAELGL